MSLRTKVSLGLSGLLVITLGASTAQAARRSPANGCAAATAGLADFDADGRPDLAVGAPYATVGGKPGAGAVIVFYGRAGGIGTVGSTVVTQASPGVQDGPQAGDHFGWSLAAADFDCDGWTDLAVGAPGEDLNGLVDLGAVHLLYGSAAGLVGDPGAGFYSFLDSPGPNDAGSRIGTALAALDWWSEGSGLNTADGFPDLAVGIPGGTTGNGGAVQVLSGSYLDRAATSGTVRTIAPTVEAGAAAGSALAAGDLDGNGTDDLVIGIPLGDAPGAADAGAVAVALVDGAGPSVWLVGDELPGTPRKGDHLGASVAVGDVNGDGRADAVAGSPGRDRGARDAGSVFVVPSAANGTGPDTDATVVIHQGSPGVPGSAGAGDRFGAALSIRNLGRGGRDDMAVGVPGKAAGGADGAGSVVVLYGSGSLFGATGNESWTQASAGIPDTAEGADAFGSALFAAERGKGVPADLAIGVPREDLGATADAGGILLLYSAGGSGLDAAGARWLTRASVDDGSVQGRARLGSAVR